MGDKFAGGVAERLDEELNSLIQDYENIKEFADFLANSTPEQRQALLNKYGDAAKKLFTDSEYRGQVGEAIVEAFKEGITDDIEKFTRIKSGDEKDIGYTTTHAALMAYGVWKRYGKKIGKDVVRAVDDDVAKNTVDSKTLKKAKDGGKQGNEVSRVNANSLKEFKSLIQRISKPGNPLTKTELKELESLTARFGGKLRYDLNPVKGKIIAPHVQIEGLGGKVQSRHIWIEPQESNYDE